jgi:Flp pilus assembly protein TadD
MMPRGWMSPPGRLQRPMLCAAGIALLLSAGCAGAPPKTVISPITTPSSTDLSADRSQSSDSTTASPTAAAATPTTTAPAAGKKKPFRSAALARSFDDAVTRGDAAWFEGDADMAVYLYVQALSFRPREVTTLSKLGVIEQRRGNLQLAARAFELAANASPADTRLSAQLGLIYLALGQDDNARTWLLRSADTASRDWRVYDGLGVVEARRGDSAAALEHLQRAQALAPGVAAPLLHRGEAMFRRGDYAGAETAVRAALSPGPTPEAWQLLGEIQAKRRAYADSLDSLLQVLDAPLAYNIVAKTALDNGDNAVALRYFEKASVLSPVYFPDAERNAAKARERLDSLATRKPPWTTSGP